MKYLSVNEIRERYLSFFESKAHLRKESFSLVPHDDPSILLINAGMTPMKKWFTGAETPPSKRVTTCQKCVRTPDIDQVGITARHGTYFEMLGNFSFGDYFKKEAIAWAWEFLTKNLEMDPARLYVTIFEDDDEAYEYWKAVGIDESHISRQDKSENFWEHGVGPCGPCSEIFFDRGEKYSCGEGCSFPCECDRYIEIWNLVFSQFERQEDGTYLPLANKNIDTGGGLERFGVVLQEVDNFFDVDNIQAILQSAAKLSHTEYGKDDKTDIALRVITDHVRSSVMMISDGIIPSNESRGYILRRLLRRAVRFGRSLNMPSGFLSDLAVVAIEQSQDAYPNLLERKNIILTHISREEASFNKTLDQGLSLLEEEISKLKDAGKTCLDGKAIFRLHDTFGFPFDLTREIAAEQGIDIDKEGFQAAMEEQRAAGRKAQEIKSASAWEQISLPDSVSSDLKTKFTGYTELEDEGKLLHILQPAEKSFDEVKELSVGEKALLIFDQSPFYAEGGGQVGDRGEILGDNAKVDVLSTTKDGKGLFFHEVEVLDGTISQGESYKLKVDRQLRLATMRNHSCTHLLHKALRDRLGEHVEQAGSYVSEDYLRFDFRHFSAMTEEEIQDVEDAVNQAILDDLPISAEEMNMSAAKEKGAMALFSEKYGDVVRVLTMGDFSCELCGGTHLERTSQACYFRILSESGIASGVRRIEAVSGEAAMAKSKEEKNELLCSAKLLKLNDNNISKRVSKLLEDNKQLHKELEKIHAGQAAGQAMDLAASSEDIAGIKLVFGNLHVEDAASLREAGDNLKNQLGDCFVLLASAVEDKVIWLAMANPTAVDKGLHCGNLIRIAAKITGGGGGGRPDMAQAGGKDKSKIDEALAAVKEEVKKILA